MAGDEGRNIDVVKAVQTCGVNSKASCLKSTEINEPRDLTFGQIEVGGFRHSVGISPARAGAWVSSSRIYATQHAPVSYGCRVSLRLLPSLPRGAPQMRWLARRRG
jgi:hypothetical protein